VYVFDRSGSSWTQSAYLKASNGEASDAFGNVVALSADGKTLLATSMAERGGVAALNGDLSDNSLFGAGAGYVFNKSNSSWTQSAYLKASNVGPGHYFGYSAAISADGATIVIGAPGEGGGASGIDGDQSDHSKLNSGAVYVFSPNDSGAWAQQAYVKASNSSAESYFGSAIAISSDGSTLAVGAMRESNVAQGVNPPESGVIEYGVGAAYVFTRSASAWKQESYLKASNADPLDNFGLAVALSDDGDMLLVTAPYEAGNRAGLSAASVNDNDASSSGAAYLFGRSQGVWMQQSYIKAPNADAEDFFGFSAAISGDGQTLGITAIGEDSAATGTNGNQQENSMHNTGAAYLY
jgi:hypothetical protein